MPTKLSIGFLSFLTRIPYFISRIPFCQSDYYFVSLSSKTYVFQDKMAKY